MAKKKPAIVQNKKEDVKPKKSKEYTAILKVKFYDDKVDTTQKTGVREIRKVNLTCSGISLTLTDKKASHLLRSIDKRVFTEGMEVFMTISIPDINQKKITDFEDSEEVEDEEEE